MTHDSPSVDFDVIFFRFFFFNYMYTKNKGQLTDEHIHYQFVGHCLILMPHSNVVTWTFLKEIILLSYTRKTVLSLARFTALNYVYVVSNKKSKCQVPICILKYNLPKQIKKLYLLSNVEFSDIISFSVPNIDIVNVLHTILIILKILQLIV